MVSFPGALDTFSNPSSSTQLSAAGTPHATQHTDANDAIEALEAKVGITASTPVASTALTGTGTGTSEWKTPVGTELAYGEITANVTTTATTSATATLIVSSGAVTYDGTAVWVEFFSPAVGRGTTFIGLVLYDGAAELGRFGFAYGATDTEQPFLARRKLTPSAGSHTYQVNAYVDAGTGTVTANTGALGQRMPAYCRVVKG